MSENTKYTVRKSDRSIFFPLLIIFIGAILLLSNLNLFPGNGWNLIVRFWPIIFVFGGIDDLLNQKWTGAIINFGVGSILILANFGFFSMSSLQIIINFWPILIIALGLEIIFSGRSIVGSLIGVGFSILLVLGLFWFALQVPLTKDAISHPINYEVGNAKQAELGIKPIVGKLTINSGDFTNQLIEGVILASNNEEIKIESELSGQTQKISISTSGNVYLPSTNMNNGFPWDLLLNTNVPFSINIEQIIGIQTLTLTEIDIQNLYSKLVIGTVEITLPKSDKFSAELECIIGEMVIIIPEGIPVTIHLDSGMTGVSLGDGFVREGDLIYSKNSGIDQGYVLNINLPIGSLKIVNP
ncbi:MAG: hypothetical protein CVU41_14875 [Chloroflexi bacterium HGW-Chloroflexi-3]|nr:MAG: hypothetical protein CVU41_14875 [Chloroflexi bacterium HGW-Chloroflexi-3]